VVKAVAIVSWTNATIYIESILLVINTRIVQMVVILPGRFLINWLMLFDI
jgi:hypothetical protein